MNKITLLFLVSLFPLYTMAQEEAKADCPCCGEAYQQFDFWVGDWEVFMNDTTLAGTNQITKAHKGCVLIENWKGVRGSSGTSINYYNRQTQQWHQHWVDMKGFVLNLSGAYADDQMILQSEIRYDKKQDAYIQDKITWTKNEDGTVRQVWEQSKDRGKTWTVAFDGLYRRVKEGTLGKK